MNLTSDDNSPDFESPEASIMESYPQKRRSAPQQKTIRLDEEMMQSVKVVAKFLGKTEQDFIIDAVKIELNKHLVTAKEQIAAQISKLPSHIQ